MAGLGLWPVNLAAWEAYQRVGNIVRESWGFPPLDWPGVIAVLDQTGRGPDTTEEWDRLLEDLELIHRARAEAQPEKPEEEDAQAKP